MGLRNLSFFLMELLAVSVISGRTMAVVISVGLAISLQRSALGANIFRGLAMVDNRVILAGAAPPQSRLC
jgi:ABC-type proline/glycine betaine transport system permease subunit